MSSILGKRRRDVPLSLPNDMWLSILEFSPDWQQLYAHGLCNWALYMHMKSLTPAFFRPYLTSHTELWALPQCVTWKNRLALMQKICQICCKPCRRGYVIPVWGMYAHVDCVSPQLISISLACERYDFTYEQLKELKHDHKGVWKYHGGGPSLNVDVSDTLQGLCLKLHHESLHDRRVRINMIREMYHADVNRMMVNAQTQAVEWNGALMRDVHHDQLCRNQRLVELRAQRHVKLDALLLKYPIHPDFAMMIRKGYFEKISIPMSWRKLEDNVLPYLQSFTEDWNSLFVDPMDHDASMVKWTSTGMLVFAPVSVGLLIKNARTYIREHVSRHHFHPRGALHNMI